MANLEGNTEVEDSKTALEKLETFITPSNAPSFLNPLKRENVNKWYFTQITQSGMTNFR